MESCFLVISFLFAFGLSSGERTLKFVTVLYRHGDRSPVMAYPADPYKESDWPQGFGQLSREGMKQHFELGQFLKKRYTGFLSESYDRHEIFIRSTDADRTLMSAEANLAGMFPPNGSEMFNPDLKWQPIPVHTVPEDQDKLLSFPLKDCPRYSQLRNETEKTNIFLNMTETYKGFLEMVRNKTGLEKPNIGNIWSLYDTLFCEAKHRMRPPDWVTPSVMETLKVLNNFGYQILFGVYKKKEKCRLQGGLLLGQIIKNLSNAAAPDSKQEVKMMVYSAHDTTVVALQEALNVFNGLQPPYASCHLIELHQEENGMFTVEMFYRNDTDVSEPYPVSLPGCSQRCSLQDFVKLTREVIPQDRDKECQIRKEATDKGAAAGEDILEEGGTKEEEEQNREAEGSIRQPSPEGPDGAKLPSECCSYTFRRNIPITTIDSYIETSVECPKPGVIFAIKAGLRICMDPQLSWVKSAMKAVDERDLYKKNEHRGHPLF